MFEKNDLDECADFSVETTDPDLKGRVDFDLKGRVKTLLAATDGGSVLLTASCSETFAGRVVLGTCSIMRAGDASAAVTITARYYRFETVVDSDVWLKQCLESGGRWQALPRDSDEFRRAEHARHAKSLSKLTDKAQQP